MEEFLRLGKIGVEKNLPKGVTLPKRATLEYNGVTHDALIQTVDITKASFQTAKGTELNFKDTWAFDVAQEPGPRSTASKRIGSGAAGSPWR